MRAARICVLPPSGPSPAISPGPLLTILAIYLFGRLHLTQSQVNGISWIPPLAWGLGYFFWGWAADRYAENNRRPIGMFLFLFFLFIRLLPMISIFEVRTLLPQAKVEEEAPVE